MVDRLLNDDQLLKDCRIDHYRGSGPGGQKRNKTSNAVRLTHLDSGLAVTATESRSLSLNKLRAVRRLRVRLASTLREPVHLQSFTPPDWFLEIRKNGRIAVAERDPHHAAAGGLILDLLTALGGRPGAVAINLGVVTTAVIRLLEAEPEFWAAANKIRKESGMAPLTHRS